MSLQIGGRVKNFLGRPGPPGPLPLSYTPDLYTNTRSTFPGLYRHFCTIRHKCGLNGSSLPSAIISTLKSEENLEETLSSLTNPPNDGNVPVIAKRSQSEAYNLKSEAESSQSTAEGSHSEDKGQSSDTEDECEADFVHASNEISRSPLLV